MEHHFCLVAPLVTIVFLGFFFTEFIKCHLYLELLRMHPHYNGLISNCFAATIVFLVIFARLFDSPNSVLTNVSLQNDEHVTRFSSKPLALWPLLLSREYYELNAVFFPCCNISLYKSWKDKPLSKLELPIESPFFYCVVFCFCFYLYILHNLNLWSKTGLNRKVTQFVVCLFVCFCFFFWNVRPFVCERASWYNPRALPEIYSYMINMYIWIFIKHSFHEDTTEIGTLTSYMGH